MVRGDSAAVCGSARDNQPGRGGEGGWAKGAAVLLVGLCAAVGAGLLGTGSKDLGLDGFACAAASAGLEIGVLMMRGSAGPGAIGVVSGMLGALLACGVFLSSTPWWVVGVLGCVAPAAVVAVGRGAEAVVARARKALQTVEGVAGGVAAAEITPLVDLAARARVAVMGIRVAVMVDLVVVEAII